MSNQKKHKAEPGGGQASPPAVQPEPLRPGRPSQFTIIKSPRKVGITDTSLRDGHQSLMATRMHTEDMIPVAEMMDEVGFHSMEVWGGPPSTPA